MGFQEYRIYKKKLYIKKHVCLYLVTLFTLTIILFPGGNLPASSQQFNDINGHWAETSINQMAEEGLVKGFPDGTFRPDNNITRAEFAALTVQTFELKNTGGQIFSDTEEHWAKDFIAAASAGGIVKGYDENVFGPDDLITREQMALMVSQAAGLQADDINLVCSDADQVSSWAKEAVAAAYGQGLLTGMPDGSFQPQEHAARAQAVIVLSKSLDMKKDPLPDEKELPGDETIVSSISIKAAPTKTTYYEGDELDLTGLIITLTRPDGSTEDISLAAFEDRGVSTDPVHGADLTSQSQKVVIALEDMIITQKISVSPAVPAGGGGGGGTGSGGGTVTSPAVKQISYSESAIIGYVFEVKFSPGFKADAALITYNNDSDPARRGFFASTAEGGNVYRYLADDVKAGDNVGFYVNGNLEQTIHIAVP